MPLGWEITLKVLWGVIVDWLNSNPGVVNLAVAIGTALLAAGTFWMGRQAKEQAQASRDMVDATRKLSEGKPSLTLWGVPAFIGPQGVKLKIQNYGRGPAQKIVVECWWSDDSEMHYFLHDTPNALNSGDTNEFDCRPMPNDSSRPPGDVQGGFLVRISFHGFDDLPYPTLTYGLANDQMDAFGTQFGYPFRPKATLP